ncbi:TPA: helix-turn-helix transcriptional regulator, partial [Enterococcus faecalis]|nr:helix-turn-helix transcriptional regulator [Enterococcus faecalis]HDU8551809.1 helix-turn-helix transcriptional regulator [Enterococcus faecalis]
MQNILYKWLILLSTEVFMNTGEKIRKYRMEKNLSQVELSSILLVSRQTISNWENGRTRPEMENLVLISNFFDVPLEVFLSEDISEIKKQHTEFTFTAKIIFIIFIS